jgi:hypothetical protein
VSEGDDGDVEVPYFLGCEDVVFIGDDVDARDNALTIGDTYTLLTGSDADGDVYLVDDENETRYVSASLFKLASTEVEGQETLPLADDDDTSEEEVPVQAPAKAMLQFTHVSGRKKKTFLASEVINLLSEHGQRGMQRITGIPRTTIQGWAKAINEQAA